MGAAAGNVDAADTRHVAGSELKIGWRKRMDRERFDELARLLATRGSRRSAIGALFGVAILGQDPDDAQAKKAKKSRKDGGGANKNNDRNNRDRNKNRNRNQSSGQNDNAGDAAQRQAAPEVEFEDAAAAPEPDANPEVRAEAARGGKRRAKGRGKGKAKGRNKKQATSRISQTQAESTRCCGTKSCTKPTVGSNRYECNFAGQNLSGLTMTGVNFGKIDGRKTNFTNANVKGSNFGDACLQGAIFKGANLASTNFDRACLFGADFTGAKNLNVSVNFSSALLCKTKLPDGTVSDRDCGKATACCAACDAQRPCTNGQLCCNGRCVTGECCATGDCDDQQCQTKSCVGNECDYTPVQNGPGPLCNTTCCNGVCCTAGQVCNTAANPDVCCTPQTKDQTCGVNTQNPKCGDVTNNCGQTVNCGQCAPRTCKTGACNDATDTCEYTNQQNGQPGTNCNTLCCAGDCCTDGQVCNTAGAAPACCTKTSQDQACEGKCGNVSDGCGGSYNCGPCTEVLCQNGSCTGPNSTCAYTPVSNGQQGTLCDDTGEFCCGGDECCVAGQVCFGNNCCTPAQNTCQGKCGDVVNNCGQTINCGRCPVVTCQTAACSGPGSTCAYTPVNNNQQGPNCDGSGQFCCGGTNCCTSGQVCDTRPEQDVCCTRNTRNETCAVGTASPKCGDVTDNCGVSVDCGPCAEIICQNGTCTGANNTCAYTPVNDGQPGTLCPEPGFCCDGDECCEQGDVCLANGCCTPNTFNQTCGVGSQSPKCGDVTDNCGRTIDCGPCAVRTCKSGVCNDATDTCEYSNQTNGQPGNNCTTLCCNGDCCTPGQVCNTTGATPVCCTPTKTTCEVGVDCGNVPDGCGGTVNCGTCPVVTCKSVACTGNTCNYTGINGTTGPNCSTVCCTNTSTGNSVCCPAGTTTCNELGNCGCPTGTKQCGAQCIPNASCCTGSTPGCSGSTPNCCVENGQGVCRACCNAGQCPTPPTCSVATCTDGVCGTAPLQDVQGPGCTAPGKICCNGFCVEDEAGQCPICCQTPDICRAAFGPQAECVGSGACRVGSVDTCVSTGKCCRP